MSRAAKSMTASPLTTLPLRVGEHSAIGITIEGDAQVGVALFGFRGNDVGMQGSAVGVDVAAVRRGVGEMDGAAEMREEFGRDG